MPQSPPRHFGFEVRYAWGAEEMKKLGKSYTAKIYEGAGHGFLRQLTGRNGANLKAAPQVWPATVAFFRERLN